MVAVTMLVIAEHFDHPALAHVPMATFVNHAPQLFAERLELGDADFNLSQVSAGDLVSGGTTRARPIR